MLSTVINFYLQAYKLKYTSHNDLKMICSGVKLSTSIIITPKTFLPRLLRITPNSLTLKYDLEGGRDDKHFWASPSLAIDIFILHGYYNLTCISTTPWGSLVISSEFVYESISSICGKEFKSDHYTSQKLFSYQLWQMIVLKNYLQYVTMSPNFISPAKSWQIH